MKRFLQPLPLRFGLVATLSELTRARRSCVAGRPDESAVRTSVIARHAIAVASALICALPDETTGEQPCSLRV
jgi:hypothetical protein